MHSTFSGVEIAKRGLFAQTRGLTTVGHNLNNIATEGYSKQRVKLEATYALYAPGMGRAETPGQIGQGVDIARVTRQRNALLDNTIASQSHKEGFWQKRNEYIQRLSEIYNEVGDSSIRSALDAYWAAWEEVATFPDQVSARIVLLERSDTLAAAIQERQQQLAQLRSVLDEEVVVTVSAINQYTKDIAILNKKIKESEALGDSPNDLLDKRDLLVDKVGSLINITVERRDPDEFLIHTDGKVLVQGQHARQFDVRRDADNASTHTVLWNDTGDTLNASGGTLAALIGVRDDDLRTEIQNLNTFTITLVDTTNALHRTGVSLNKTTNQDFFVERPAVLNAQGNYDADEDGIFDQSRLYRITGSNVLEPTQNVGFAGILRLPGTSGDEIIEVAYNGSDTIQNIVDRINASGAEVVAAFDHESKLVIRATASHDPNNPDFVIRSLEDSGEFLAGYSGLLTAPDNEGAYTWQEADAALSLASDAYGVAPFLDPAASIGVHERLVRDPREVAAASYSQDGIADTGNGRIAAKIAHVRTADAGFSQGQSFEDFFADTTASLASSAQEALTHKETHELIMKKLHDERASISKVNLDEELQNMIKYQTAYRASAQFLTYINTTYETLLNMV